MSVPLKYYNPELRRYIVPIPQINGTPPCSIEMVGSSPSMLKLYRDLEKVARTKATVLILGETGTGKELVAQIIHYQSSQYKGPYLPINCSTIPDTLAESELFGHKKGAFTGAAYDHKGHFRSAHTGTLFLDEIGELTLNGQVKLLRVLEQKTVTPLGASKSEVVDVRVLAATHRDLTENVKRGAFRSDLFYRLNVLPVTLPPLRERREDIPLLAPYILERIRAEENTSVQSIESSALERLTEQHWGGNIRELEHVLLRSALLCETETLSADDLLF